MGPAELVIIGAVVVVVLIVAIAFALLRSTFRNRHDAVEQAWRQVHVELVRRQDTAGELLTLAAGRFDQEPLRNARAHAVAARGAGPATLCATGPEIGRASCRERV